MIIAVWAKGKNGANQFPDGSGWFVRYKGVITGGAYGSRRAAREAYRLMKRGES